MEIDPNFIVPRSPMLPMESTGSYEKRNLLVKRLKMLETEANNFCTAVAFFHFCRHNNSEGLFQSWTFTAARDGALALRNFELAITRVKAIVRSVEGLNYDAITIALRSASKKFNQKFPNADDIRNSVANPEHYSDPTKNGSIERPRSIPGFINISGWGISPKIDHPIWNI